MINPYPVIHSIPDPKTLAKEVNNLFGIGDISECKFFSGGFNDTYRLKTTQNRVYYIRIYRIEWRTLADIQFELEVLNHLDMKGFPVAKPILNKMESYFWDISAPEGQRYAALFREAPGKDISYDSEPGKMAYQYGRSVAQMHNFLGDFISQHKRFLIDLDHLIEKPLKNIAPFLSHRPDDRAYLQEFAGKVRYKIQSMPTSTLEQGVCHADLQGYHAKVSDNGIFTFFDFDCGGYGFRAYDLAVFLWCCRLQDAVKDRWESYLQGYQITRSLNTPDLKAIPYFVCTRYLWHMGVHTQNAPDWGIGWLSDDYFDNRLAQLHHAEADYLSD